MCKCGNHNYKARAACAKCSLLRNLGQAIVAPPTFKPGDWMCKCGNHNYGNRVGCNRCQLHRSVCDAVLSNQSLGNLLGIKNTAVTTGTTNFRAGDWMCRCGNHNYASRMQCKKCNIPKHDGQDVVRVPAPPTFKPGDWMCQCGNHNYSSRDSCARCRVPKAQVFKNLTWFCFVIHSFRALLHLPRKAFVKEIGSACVETITMPLVTLARGVTSPSKKARRTA